MPAAAARTMPSTPTTTAAPEDCAGLALCVAAVDVGTAFVATTERVPLVCGAPLTGR